MIVVTGATGALGGQVVEHLLRRLPAEQAEQVGVAVRDPARAAGLSDRGVRVRRGDYAEPGTLAAAFEGASQVLVVSSGTLGEQGVAQHRTAIDAAYAAGARRVLYTSHQAAAADSAFAPAVDHAATEAHLASTGRPYVSLRNGYYDTSLLFHLGDAVRTGEILAPLDGPVAWTARTDLAEAAAAVLLDESLVDGVTPALVGAPAMDLADVAARLSDLTDREIRRVVIDDEKWVQGRIAGGMPEVYARMLLGSYVASRRGEFDARGGALQTLLGRPPRPVTDTLRATASGS